MHSSRLNQSFNASEGGKVHFRMAGQKSDSEENALSKGDLTSVHITFDQSIKGKCLIPR
jgi:hypothetical protein